MSLKINIKLQQLLAKIFNYYMLKLSATKSNS